MLFKSNNQNSVFRNIDGGFVYQPDIEIESTTYFHINNKWIKEFDYIIPTNNFGLVQTTDLHPNKKSILFLGDSLISSVDLIIPMLILIIITPILHRSFNLIGYAIGWKDVPY